MLPKACFNPLEVIGAAHANDEVLIEPVSNLGRKTNQGIVSKLQCAIAPEREPLFERPFREFSLVYTCDFPFALLGIKPPFVLGICGP